MVLDWVLPNVEGYPLQHQPTEVQMSAANMRKVLENLETVKRESQETLKEVFKTWCLYEMVHDPTVKAKHSEMVQGEDALYIGVFPSLGIAIRQVSFHRFDAKYGWKNYELAGWVKQPKDCTDEDFEPSYTIHAWGYRIGKNGQTTNKTFTEIFYILEDGATFKSHTVKMEEEREERIRAKAEERIRLRDEKGRENLGKELWDQLEERSKEDLWKAWAKAKIEPVS